MFLAGSKSGAMTQSGVPSDRVLLWQRITGGMSLEYAHLIKDSGDIRIVGTVLMVQIGVPLRVDYRLQVDSEWRTKSLSLEQVYLGARSRMDLSRNERNEWALDGAAAPLLTGCTDIDLNVTPSTNALPVNRLRLKVGEEAAVRVAWIGLPEAQVLPAQQSYSRTAADRYRYRSMESGFEGTIVVDSDGFPLEHSGVWSRVGKESMPVPLDARDPRRQFCEALVSAEPAPALRSAAAAFDWLIGGWQGDVIDFEPEGALRRGQGEWWFSWVLEGRAIQDVWIVPRRSLRDKPLAHYADNRYGTTLRTFDAQAGVWTITWLNPVSGARNVVSGKRLGDQIVLEGVNEDRIPIRWSFVDIKKDSFIWRGESQEPPGTWKLGAEFRLNRIVQDINASL
jgi:hypothetical protein